jgi:translation initiation factor 4E
MVPVPRPGWAGSPSRLQRAGLLEQYWLEILIFLIGEQAGTHAHQVTGAVVNLRAKGDKLAVWLADSGAPDSVIRVGRMVKERLGVEEGKQINFTIHKEEKSRPGGGNKKKFVV